MPRTDYPIDLRADYPARSSRGWAVLTIFLIKLIALIPHAIILVFLGIAQFVVAIVAQVAVALNGEYPAGMYSFVAGVLRWQMRVTAFLLSLTDRYPPFTLQPDGAYPIDVAAERPAQSSRVYALFTLLVEVLAVALIGWFLIELARGADWPRSFLGLPADGSTSAGRTPTNYNFNATGWSGLLLRQIAAIPHLIVLAILGIALFVAVDHRAMGHPVRRALPPRHVRLQRRRAALAGARGRLHARADRPLSSVHVRPVHRSARG